MISVAGVSPLPTSALPTNSLPPAAAAGSDPRTAGSGEQAASGRGAETVDRIEAARQPDRALRVRDEERRADAPPEPAPERPTLTAFFAPPTEAGPQLLPPDRTAPTGPPPAFDRSPLDAERELGLNLLETRAEALRSPDATPTGPQELSGAAPVSPDEAEPAQAEADPANGRELTQADVPPRADERAQTEFSSIRRMETPYDTATVDVTR